MRISSAFFDSAARTATSHVGLSVAGVPDAPFFFVFRKCSVSNLSLSGIVL